MSMFRLKCSSCGQVVNGEAGSACPRCAKAFTSDTSSYIQSYRMGSPLGIAVGYGVYINGEPYGHLGNKESIRIPLPYGKYNISFTCGMTRKCDPLAVELSENAPIAYVKAHIQAGFFANKIVAEVADAASMPEIN